MKDLEKNLGPIKLTPEQKLSMRQLFELYILTAARLMDIIPAQRYIELVTKRFVNKQK